MLEDYIQHSVLLIRLGPHWHKHNFGELKLEIDEMMQQIIHVVECISDMKIQRVTCQ